MSRWWRLEDYVMPGLRAPDEMARWRMRLGALLLPTWLIGRQAVAPELRATFVNRFGR